MIKKFKHKDTPVTINKDNYASINKYNLMSMNIIKSLSEKKCNISSNSPDKYSQTNLIVNKKLIKNTENQQK